jgi:ubiquinone/menaquinone biosynthesis C-methylase UbiE
MAMTGLEKRFVNRKKKAERNVGKVCRNLNLLDISQVRDVLEIGCGIGSVSAYLAQTWGMQVWGTDFDPEQVKIAKELYPSSDHLRYKVEDASNLSFDSSSFDLVVSQNTFHHIPNWKRAICEVARVLRPQGYFLWFDLAFPRLIIKLFQPLTKSYALYTIDEIRSEFSQNQFETIFSENMLHGPFMHHNLVLQKKSEPV